MKRIINESKEHDVAWGWASSRCRPEVEPELQDTASSPLWRSGKRTDCTTQKQNSSTQQERETNTQRRETKIKHEHWGREEDEDKSESSGGWKSRSEDQEWDTDSQPERTGRLKERERERASHTALALMCLREQTVVQTDAAVFRRFTVMSSTRQRARFNWLIKT